MFFNSPLQNALHAIKSNTLIWLPNRVVVFRFGCVCKDLPPSNDLTNIVEVSLNMTMLRSNRKVIHITIFKNA